MVRLRPNVWFKADFPNDAVYDEDGNEVQFAGQAVAQAVANLLRARGYRVSEPENGYENGWSLNAHTQGQRFWMQVTFIDDYILQTQDMTWRLWPNQAGYIALLTALDASLKSDPRFTDLRWWVKDWPPTEAESFPGPL